MVYLWAFIRVLVVFVLSIILYTVSLFLCRVFVIKVCAGLVLLSLFFFFSSLFEEICRHAMQICRPSATMDNGCSTAFIKRKGLGWAARTGCCTQANYIISSLHGWLASGQSLSHVCKHRVPGKSRLYAF